MERILQLALFLSLGLCYVWGQDVPVQPAPPDGEWGEWGQWSFCYATCGNETRQRNRECENPHGGLDCPGDALDTGFCDNPECPIDGGWGEWGEFSACPVTCGDGSITRRRECNNPLPQHGGTCTGAADESEPCTVDVNCPVDGAWGEWGEPTPCSVTCGGEGVITRQRECNNPPPQHGGAECPGDAEESITCKLDPYCSVDGAWAEWGVWSSCSVSCGGEGSTRRERECNNPPPQHGGAGCPSDSDVETSRCMLDPNCPAVNGAWGEWGAWNGCDQPCGVGSRMRNRECDNPSPSDGGADCPGERLKTGTCPVETQCDEIVQGGWGDWLEWSACSRTCGLGFRIRRRMCNNPSPSNWEYYCDQSERAQGFDFASCKTKCPTDETGP